MSFTRFFTDISIKAKFIIFLGLIIAQSAGTILFLRHQMESNYVAIVQQHEQLKNLKNIKSIQSHFSQVMYWFTEMAVTLSGESETYAMENIEGLKNLLTELETYDLDLATGIKETIPEVEERYFDAIDAFFDGNQNEGAKLIAEARTNADALYMMIEDKAKEMRGESEEMGNFVMNISTTAISIATLLLITMVITSVFITYLLNTLIVSPINEATKTMKTLAEGDYETVVPNRSRKDEIGMISGALDIFRQNGIEQKIMEGQKDHENQLKEARTKEIENITDSFEGNVQNIATLLKEQIGQVESYTNDMMALAQTTNKEFVTASEASQEASMSVQEVANTVEQFNHSISDIAEQIKQANHITNETAKHTETTNQQVNALNEAGQKIQQAVNLIDDIAEKTNLLALNATIEAARAGEAGKGFAVVANEVKALANQTGQATEEIASLAKSIQSSTIETVKSMTEITDKISEVSSSSSAIANDVNQQHTAIQSIAQNAISTAESNKKADASINGVSENSYKTEIAAKHVLDAVQSMTEKQSELDNTITGFLQKIKSV